MHVNVILGTNQNACNDAILADLGRFPVFIYSARRSIKFWLIIVSSPNDRYLKLCYNMLFYYGNIVCTNWVTHIREHLYENGYGCVWEQQEVAHLEMFVSEYTDRMKCQHVQHWRTRCSLISKLQLYVDFNHDYNVAKYILPVDIFKLRRTMSNFRSSSHPLMIEKGRHYNIDREARTCPYCETCIENELHLVLQCPLYVSLRCKNLHDMFVNDVSEASYV